MPRDEVATSDDTCVLCHIKVPRSKNKFDETVIMIYKSEGLALNGKEEVSGMKMSK